MKTANIVITIIVLVLIGIGAYFVFGGSSSVVDNTGDGQDTATTSTATTTDDSATTTDDANDDEADNADTADDTSGAGRQTVIGTSVEGRDITAYQYGTGETELLFVAGIHGGYGYNTSLLSYDMINYLDGNANVVPENVTVTIIPALNPDGLQRIAGTIADDFTAADMPSLSETIPGRFNANEVDLNRNFDCNWESESTWQSRTVSGGDAAFSEPESQAIRDYVNTNNPAAAVVYYSAAGGVYSSSCDGPVLSETNEIMNTYADASGYPAEGEFAAYAINGDMVNWLAKENIPAISVLLTNHQDAEFSENRAGFEAMLDFYAN